MSANFKASILLVKFGDFIVRVPKLTLNYAKNKKLYAANINTFFLIPNKGDEILSCAAHLSFLSREAHLSSEGHLSREAHLSPEGH